MTHPPGSCADCGDAAPAQACVLCLRLLCQHCYGQSRVCEDCAEAVGRLYDADPPRNAMRPCRNCTKQVHETVMWCTTCGHMMGVPRQDCLCGKCLREKELT